ncbi:hypothetical protein [Microbacterium schleiferi]|jgi:hypothetical protein|uniref:hypothetical protein n=1 Tax=Microbacterium schleiferi TaxID=69362 RepID=UPI00312039A2
MTTTATPPSVTAPAPKPIKKTPIWAKILLVGVVIALIGVAAYFGVAWGRVLGATESRDVSVIRSITREEQVVLVTTGVGDTLEEREDGFEISIPGLEAFAFNLPGSDRTLLVRYDFDAKLGIEGKDVTIERLEDNAYLISIPQFLYLGYANPDISVVSERNGVLSWTTPEIDKFAVIEAVLDDEMVTETVEGARPVLEEQAEEFYSGIIHAIDPTITLEFEFAD